MGICWMTQGTQTRTLWQDEEWDGEGDGKEVQKGGDSVYLRLILVDVWQKTTKFCKAIILQLKKFFFLRIAYTCACVRVCE